MRAETKINGEVLFFVQPAKMIKMKVGLSDAAKPYASMIMNRVHLVIQEHHEKKKMGGPIKGNSMAGLLVKISNQRSGACFPLLLDPGINDEHFNGTFNWTWDTIMPLYETYKRGEVTWVEQLLILAKFIQTSDRTKMTINIWKRENTKLKKGEREDTGILKTVSGTSKPVTALLHAILMKNANIGRIELYTSQDSSADKVDFRANFEETVSWDKKGQKQEYLYTKKKNENHPPGDDTASRRHGHYPNSDQTDVRHGASVRRGCGRAIRWAS